MAGTLPTGGNGTYTYYWEQNSSGTWVAAAGTNNTQNYTPGTLTQTTQFRRTVTAGVCAASVSSAVTITVNPLVGNNTITADQTICTGTAPIALAGTLPTGGNGTYTYYWEQNSSGTWVAAAGTNNTQNYTPGTLTQTTQFRRTVTAGVCAASVSSAVTITVNPLVGNNTITADQTICTGTAPVALAGTLPTGGNETYTYLWEQNTSGTWAAATGTNNTQNYTPATLTQTTQFRRTVTAGICAASVSSAVTITVNPLLTNNTITADQTICTGTAPVALAGTLPTGGNGTYVYLWEQNTSGTWTAAAGTNNTQNYTPGTLTQTTQFRRTVTAGICAASVSSAVTITVNPLLTNNTITADQTICAGTAPVALAGTLPTGGNGTYVYLWEQNSSGTWVAAAGTNNTQNYTPGTLTQTTQFRRTVTAGICAASVSSAVTITVNPLLTNNTITADQTICTGTAPVALAGTLPTGGNGTYVYLWEQNSSGTWVAAAGTNNTQNYTPGTLTQTTQFRRTVTAGVCAASVSPAVTITVNPLVGNNTITADQTICTGTAPVALAGTLPTGGNGTYAYLWEQNTSGTWVAATGTNNTQNYTPATLTQTTQFRRTVTAGVCAASVSPAVTITVNPLVGNNTITADQTICTGTAPTALAGTLPTGGNGTYVYLWEQNTSGTWAAATGTNNTQNYTPATLIQTTQFRRTVTAGVCAASVSPAVTITVNPLVTNNTITADQTICTGTAPTALAGTLPTGGNGTYTYYWEQNTSGAWAAATGTINTQNYTPATLTQTTQFRRTVTAGVCAASVSPAVTITVNPLVGNNTITADQTICTGTAPTALAGTLPTGGNGTYTYYWEQNTSGTWAAATGTNNTQNYTPGTLTQTTQFRRTVTAGVCAASVSSAVTITVNPLVTNNTITADQTICTGTAPVALAGNLPTGGNGTYAYLWEQNTSGTWAAATGTNNTQNYTPATLTQTTQFRRTVTAGVCAASVSSAVTITVNLLVTNNTITADQTICTGTAPVALAGTLPTGGNGTYAYLWEQNTSGTWVAATGTNNTQNYTPATLTQTTQFRRTVTAGICAASVSPSVTVMVNPVVANNTITADQTICTGTAPVALAGTLPTGGNGTYAYLWEQNTSGTWVAATGTNNTQNYTPATLTQTTQFRRTVSAGVCAASVSPAVTITVNPLPTATILGTATVCQNAASTGITFTGANGTAPYTFAYKVNNGVQQTITTIAGNSINLAQSTSLPGTFEFTLISVTDASSAGCTNLQSGTAKITVNPTPQGFNDVSTVDCTGVFSYDIQNTNINNTSKGGNSVASSYTWTVNANTNIIGASNGTGNSINQTLINISNTTQTIVYTVTPKATLAGGCVGNSFTVSVTVPVCSSLSIAKVANVASVNQVGNIINYTITVSNTGNTDQNNVVLTDALLGGALINPIKTGNSNNILEKGEVWTYNGSYTVLQADLNNNGNPSFNSGKITNTASIQTTELPIAKVSTAEVNIFLSPSITLVKTVNGTVPTTVGGVLNYNLVIKNTGNVTLTNLVVTDANAIVAGSPIATLAPNATITITASHTLTQADVDAGSYSNSASITAKPPVGANVTDISGTTETNDTPTVTSIVASPSITLVKTVNGTVPTSVGGVLNYNLVIKNTGNVTLTNLVVTDANATVTGSSISTLAPNATITITASHTLTQGDVDAGSYSNSASITAKPPVGANVTDISGTTETNDTPTETPIVASPSITLVKTGVLSTDENSIAYTFTLKNTGNVTLTNISVSDVKITSGITMSPLTLAPGASATGTATYIITQAEKDAGSVSNTATATAKPPVGANVTATSTSGSGTGPTVITFTPKPSITLVKAVSGAVPTTVGGVLNYNLIIKNTGNVTLSNLTITDANAVVTGSPIATLAPNTTTTITASHTLTQADVDAGTYSNSASITAKPPVGANVTDISGTTETNDTPTVTPIVASPSITLVKAVSGTVPTAVGGVLNYNMVIKNTGNVTLSNLIITDANAVVTGSPIATLAPNTTTTITASHTLTQADVDAGTYSNSASITAKPPVGANVTDISGTTEANDTPTVTTIVASPSITLVKTGVLSTDENSIAYTFTVKNTGNVTLTNISVSDVKIASGITMSPLTLAPGASATGTATYIITQAEKDAGSVSNTATAIAKPPVGANVTATSTSGSGTGPTVITFTPKPSVTLVKTVNGTVPTTVGGVLNYNLVIKNTGNVTLSNLTITDANAVVTGSPIATLAPNTTTTITASHTLTQADVDAGTYSNSASITAKPPVGANVTDISGTTETNDTPTVTPIVASPSITLVKTGVLRTDENSIAYTFTVKNTGNVTLTNISVSDVKIASGITMSPLTLAPGASATGTATYIITQAEKDAGSVSNTATATAKPPVGANVTATSTSGAGTGPTVIAFTPKPSVNLVKAGVLNLDGNSILYTFIIKNTGNVTLSGLSVTDLKISTPITLAATTLVPGASTTATSTYIILAAEKANGSVSNTADITGKSPTNVTVTDQSGTTENNDTPTIIYTGVFAVNDEGSANAVLGGTAVLYVLANDKVNGNQASLSNVSIKEISSSDPKVTLDITSGKVNVAANTPAGDYTLIYQIEDKSNPGNTKEAIVIVHVSSGTLSATNDNGTANGLVGGDAINNVLSNDFYNGTSSAPTLADIYLTQVSTSNSKVVLDIATGIINVAANTPAGTYTVVYQIIDKLDTNQVKQATATIIVTAPTMVATNDSGSANGFVGGTAVNDVLANDTYNGSPATLTNVTLSPISTTNPNISLDVTTGKVNVAANTPAGTYTVVYQIEDKLNPGQVKTASVTITVDAPTMVATNDSGAANGFVGGTAVNDVLANDTYNGNPATLANVSLTQVSTTNNNVTLDIATGKVYVAANTPAGSYTVVYQIEDKLNPGQTKTASVTITVDAPTMVATNDSGSANGFVGGTAVSDVLANDTYNGNPATLTNVTLSQISTTNPNISLDVTTGKVNVAANTPAGTYTLVYQIEDKLNPGQTKTASVTITVDAPAMVATNDSGSANGFVGGTAVNDVLANDTYNGNPATLANVALTQVSTTNPNISLDVTSGKVNVAANTPAGSYTVVYQIEDKLNPGQTKTASVTITVDAPTMVATNDSGSANGFVGGTAVNNVLANDTYNGNPATLTNVTLSQISTTNPNISLDVTTGKVNVAANTPAGTYTVVYQIEDKLNPGQVKTASVTITVDAPAMVATNDSGAANGFVGGTAVNDVLANDTYNGNPATLANVSLTQVSTTNPNISLDVATGKVNVAANTPAGTYTVVYQIEDKLNPGQTKTASVTITVDAPVMVATNDSGSANGFVGGTAVNDVLANDTYNGNPATLANVTLTQVSTTNPNISLDVTTGKVNVAANTPAGTYTVVYQIEDKLNPGQTKTASVTITVDAPIMVATNDSGSANGFVGGTAVSDVLANDTYNGNPATLANVSLTQVSTTNNNVTLDIATGKVNVAANTPAGSYTVVYQIEDKLNPGQTKTASLTIIVGTGVILANEDAGSANGYLGGVAVENILANDKYDGTITATLATVSITQISSTDPKVSIDPNTGKVNVAAGTQPGTYVLEYKITDKLDASKSSTAKVIVTVPNWITDLQVSKVANSTGVEANANMRYTISIKNNGPATVLAGKAIGLIENLPAGLENITYTAIGGTYNAIAGTFTLSADLLNGQQVTLTVNGRVASTFAGTSLINTVSLTPASGTIDPENSNNQASVTTNILKGKIALVKTAALSADGNTINYTFNITNIGDVDLSDVVLTDAKLGLNKTFPGNLSVGASITYSQVYTLSQSEKDAGSVSNSASVTSKTPAGNVITDISGTGTGNDTSTDTPISSQPAFTFTKVANVVGKKAGESITYTFSITNTGNVTLNNLVVTDALVDAGSINPTNISSLAPGATATVTAKHTLTQGDLDNGNFKNQATIKLTDNKGNVVTKLSDNPATPTVGDATITTLAQSPSYTFTKAATNAVSKAGDVINYEILFTNTGNVTLSSINLTDVKADAGSLIPSVISSVVPGETVKITAKHTVTQNDVNAGSFSNQASAASKDPHGNVISKVSDDPSTPAANDATVTSIVPNASVRFTKLIANGAGVVKVIEYSIKVTNTGNITLTDIVVTDPGADAGSITPSVIKKLDPAETAIVSARHTLIQPEIDYGKFVNQASLVASFAGVNKLSKLSDDPTTAAPDDATVFIIPEAPAITLVKTGALSADGNSISYTFIATNRGNVTLNNFSLVDAKLSTPVVFTPSSIAPDESATATVIYTISQAEKNAGTVSNTARITANTPTGTKVSDISGTAETNNNPTILELPKLSSTKTVADANGNGIAEANEVLTYTITVKNGGNIARTGVKVSDPIPANTTYVNASANAGGLLASNAVNWNNLTIPANSQITVSFKVTVNATIPSGTLAINNIAIITDPGNASATLNPSVSIPTEGKLEGSKSVSDGKGNNDGKAQANEVLTYSLEVRNTGGSALNGVVISDELPAGLTYVPGSVSGYGTVTNNTLKWTINMQPNSSTVLTFDAKVAPDVNSYSTLKNVVLMTSPTGLTIQPQATIDVDKSADLVITKELMTKGDIATGSEVMYKITVTNKGANKATGVTVTDKIPTIIDAPKEIIVTVGTTSYSATTRDLVWLVGTLDLNQTATITFKSRTLASGPLSNSATVKGDQPDPVTNNNSVLADGATITGSELLIPNLFTPNGDGRNDAFEIRGLTEFAENEVTIVNRWGNEVYRAKNYQNNWTGEGLNEGTYYYLVKARKAGSAEWKVFKGYITLIRAFKN
ncbi:DUF7507 domain-containing protein [Pedobacter frigidisoli]|uniref:DUF7507 domain-containing protein n=1 Tax=Pedobacter frigidisoli TaxID=2530455 RepID=UPI00198124BC|nr:gliding motility-associated C-terminal domain-containing protein [Pedobacter frigidisoli]